MMDGPTFTTAVRQYQGLMLHVSYSLLHRQEDCADAVQETLLKAWRARASLRDPALFKPWLLRILVNTCHNCLRQRRHESTAMPDDIPAVTPDFLPLHDALARLDDDLRLPLVLHYLEDLPVKDIASILRLPVSTVKNRLFRGRRALAAMLGEEEWL